MWRGWSRGAAAVGISLDDLGRVDEGQNTESGDGIVVAERERRGV